MSKLERMFMQIFDRRNWIVDQLKSQGESYDQSLASCLLINGIEPPPWLSSIGLGTQNSDLIELKKELTRDTVVPLNCAPLQTGVRDMQDSLELDKSLLRIQRSRSRQRAIELRSSAKPKKRKHACEEDPGNRYAGRVTRSRSARELPANVRDLLEPENAPNSSILKQSKPIIQQHTYPDGKDAFQKASGTQTTVPPESAQNKNKNTASFNNFSEVMEPQPCSIRNDTDGLVLSASHSIHTKESWKGEGEHKVSVSGRSLHASLNVQPTQLDFDDVESVNCSRGHAFEKENWVSHSDTEAASVLLLAVKKHEVTHGVVKDVMDSQTCNNGSKEKKPVSVALGEARPISENLNSEPSPKTNFVFESNQLDFDDAEDCSSKYRFQAAVEKEKAYPFAEERASAQLGASQSSNGKSVLDGCCEMDDLNAEQLMLGKAVSQSADVMIEDEIASVDSIEDVSKKQLELIDDTSLKNKISKICGDAEGEPCSVGKHLSNWIALTPDNLSASQGLIGKDRVQKIIQTAANNFLDSVSDQVSVGKYISEIDVRPADRVLENFVVSEEFLDMVAGEVSCCTPDGQVDVGLTGMLPSDCGFVGYATNGSIKSRSFPLIKRSSSLQPGVPKMVETEGKEISSVAINSRKSDYTRTLTRGSSQMCDQRRETRYFLRSSTGHNKIIDSLKSNTSNIFSGKSNVAENFMDACMSAVRLSGIPCDDEVCYGLKEASDFTDSHVDCYQSFRPDGHLTSIECFGPDKHQTSVESPRASTSAGKQVVTPCSLHICDEQQEAACNLWRSMNQNKNAGSSKSSVSVSLRNSLQLSLNVTNACGVSWPMNKRRKVKNGSNYVFHTSPLIGRTNPLMQISKENFFDHLSLHDSPVDIVEPHNFLISPGLDVGHLNVGSSSTQLQILSSTLQPKQDSSEAITKLGSSCSLGVEKGGLNLEVTVHPGSISAAMENMEAESLLDMGENKQEDVGLGDFSKEPAVVEGSNSTNQEMMRQLTSGSAEVSDEWQISLGGDGRKKEKPQSNKNPIFPCCSASSTYAEALETGGDETLPELEGFSISVSPPCELPLVTGDGNGVDNLVLPCMKKDLAVFEQIYGSISLPVSLSCPSTMHSMMDIKYSLPTGLLPQMNFKDFIPLNGTDEKQCEGSEDSFLPGIGCSSGVEYGSCLLGKSYSFTPPVGRFSSKSTRSSMGKNSCLNKELTCFRIDEDLCINEENEVREVVDPSENLASSREISTPHKRHVLDDATSEYSNSISLVSEARKIQDLSSLAFGNTDGNMNRTQRGNRGLENGYWDQQIKNDDKENCGHSMDGYSARKTSGSLRNRSDRPKVSGKASEAKGGQSFIEKASKPKNLVSNISSFVPLVQQKQQPPAILTGKRDIKVKALEAAEAAKRLEEERENTRRIRKETAKLEREKLEQENIRQLELKRKKKVEERKKKEADIVSRKRQREQEERKEKERKRRCIEEARKQQQEREEKLRAEKEEKEMRRKAAEEERKRKALAEEARRLRKMEKAKEGTGNKKRTEPEERTTKVVNDLDSFKSDGAGFSTEGSLEPQSYEISPYQSSDDEEEEEEGDVPVRKFIPEWAREKSIVRSLDFLHHVNPDDIFLLERCCNISEILLHQKR
ncbi:uncharacterized protein [Aristolochia californica]|uniref:uncharacterized protein n=1 Tax=Aristolochia californica TaxID=171875 RepID=UPI0035D9A4D0